MQRSALCRSRRELSNAYLLAKIGVDTAENEPCKVCPLSVYRSPRCVAVVATGLTVSTSGALAVLVRWYRADVATVYTSDERVRGKATALLGVYFPFISVAAGCTVWHPENRSC